MPTGGQRGSRETLSEPVVSPGLYDDHYYRNWCAGYEEWVASNGADVNPAYPAALERTGLAPGEVLVDIGTGRAELLAIAVERGAKRAIGIEYAPAAVELARQTLAAHGATERAEVMLADARALPLADGVADLATMLDVVEHLSPAELHAVLCETRRVLRPGGRLMAHTTPNRLIYDVTYRIQRALVPARRRRWPADPRIDFEHSMHVNEQTIGSLKRALARAGFDRVQVGLGSWVYAGHVPDRRARRLYRRLARLPLARRLAVADIWAEARAP